jgi:hypothetical protein
MWVIEDHRALRAHILPDHAGDRGTARLDPGASRSPAYQPDEGVSGVRSVATAAQISPFCLRKLIVAKAAAAAPNRRLLARRMSVPPPPSVTASGEVVGSDCGRHGGHPSAGPLRGLLLRRVAPPLEGRAGGLTHPCHTSRDQALRFWPAELRRVFARWPISAFPGILCEPLAWTARLPFGERFKAAVLPCHTLLSFIR